MQDLSGLQPVYQNIGQQQAMQQAALSQQNQLANQAGQSQGGGMNPMAMAMMLRKKDPNEQSLGSKMGTYAKSIPAIMQYGSENVYGGFGQGQTPTEANWDADITSNVSNSNAMPFDTRLKRPRYDLETSFGYGVDNQF
jgi:hypothetical protein